MALAPLLSAAAAEDSVYRVSDVFVDATAETATAAREAAIAEAHVAAMQRLVSRLVMEQDLARLPQLTASQVADYVRDFSVSDERTAAGRYLASFSFRFNPASVRALFQQYGVRFAETQSKPLVVVPLWSGGEQALLWRETNPWLQAWSARRFDEGLVPLITPLGDLGDVATVNAEQVLAGEPVPLGSLAARYQAAGALVAQAVLLGSIEDGTASLAVTMSRLLEDGLSKIGVLNFKQEPGEELEELLERAALAVSEAAAARWKEANLLNFGSRQTIAVTVPIASLDGWLRVRRLLDGITTVIAADLQYLRRDEARMNLTFVGSEEQLIGALAQQDLQLVRLPTNGPALQQMPQPPGMTVGGSSGAVLSPVQPGWELRLLGATPSAGLGAGQPAVGRDGLSQPGEPTIEVQ